MPVAFFSSPVQSPLMHWFSVGRGRAAADLAFQRNLRCFPTTEHASYAPSSADGFFDDLFLILKRDPWPPLLWSRLVTVQGEKEEEVLEEWTARIWIQNFSFVELFHLSFDITLIFWLRDSSNQSVKWIFATLKSNLFFEIYLKRKSGTCVLAWKNGNVRWLISQVLLLLNRSRYAEVIEKSQSLDKTSIFPHVSICIDQ